MNMNIGSDAISIAAKRLQVESVKPITQTAQTPVEERLMPHSGGDIQHDVSYKKNSERGKKRPRADSVAFGAEEQREEQAAETLSPTNDEEHRLLDVKV